MRHPDARMEQIGKMAWFAYQMANCLGEPELEEEVKASMFIDLPKNEQDAWCAAAQAVAEEFKRRTQDVFFGYTTI